MSTADKLAEAASQFLGDRGWLAVEELRTALAAYRAERADRCKKCGHERSVHDSCRFATCSCFRFEEPIVPARSGGDLVSREAAMKAVHSALLAVKCAGDGDGDHAVTRKAAMFDADTAAMRAIHALPAAPLVAVVDVEKAVRVYTDWRLDEKAPVMNDDRDAARAILSAGIVGSVSVEDIGYMAHYLKEHIGDRAGVLNDQFRERIARVLAVLGER